MRHFVSWISVARSLALTCPVAPQRHGVPLLLLVLSPCFRRTFHHPLALSQQLSCPRWRPLLPPSLECRPCPCEVDARFCRAVCRWQNKCRCCQRAHVPRECISLGETYREREGRQGVQAGQPCVDTELVWVRDRRHHRSRRLPLVVPRDQRRRRRRETE